MYAILRIGSFSTIVAIYPLPCGSYPLFSIKKILLILTGY